jgi:hypothetical protein
MFATSPSALRSCFIVCAFSCTQSASSLYIMNDPFCNELERRTCDDGISSRTLKMLGMVSFLGRVCTHIIYLSLEEGYLCCNKSLLLHSVPKYVFTYLKYFYRCFYHYSCYGLLLQDCYGAEGNIEG